MSFQMGFVLMFIATMIMSYIGTHIWCKWATKKGFLDVPNERKVHNRPIITMGGVVIFIVYWLAVFLLTVMFRLVVREQVPLFFASLVIFVTGIIDDRYDISPLQKSLGIIIAATIVYWTTNFRIYGLFEQIFGDNLTADIVGYIATVVWIYYITNALNLIDGLDGLSTGVSIIALSTLGFISYLFSPVSVFILTMMVLLLVATLLGFLPHNFHPARIFIGDTGVLFIGFMLSVFCLMGIQRPGIVAIITPIVILGVPLTDTTMAILRRFLKGQSVTKADRKHMHHCFMMKGKPHARAVMSMYGIGFIFAVIALMLTLADVEVDVYVILALTIVGEFLLIDYLNLLDLKNPILFKETSYRDKDKK
ncbi:undecaprenyl/decaprenyl-phosphate alpha-N-acetylglucosaminyl 1-phosphate transferase [Granulicatella sp. zg-ZJ]|uniref:glycosyltransferase family 4 protein n=1 Tax=Granulicatella sp. zg-ZJ TaxID=2678504 RepID=UPI0013D1CFDE|nr:undecaprenyl/decaprenyl-phosphate alpha-N-acetylglucosaminyl 1-phosphate transferase [Granulicatella sp. zg-ZJ]